MPVFPSLTIRLVTLSTVLGSFCAMESSATGVLPRITERDAMVDVSQIDRANGHGPRLIPQPSAVTLNSGTHTNSASVTNGGVVQDNPSFSSMGAAATNPPANAIYTTAAPTSQTAASTVSALFDGTATFTVSETASLNGTRPAAVGNSEDAHATSTFSFTLDAPTPYTLTGNSMATLMGGGGSANFTVTLSQIGFGVISTNGNTFGPFSFSGILGAGSYTIFADIHAFSTDGSDSGVSVTENGNYTLSLVPEPSSVALIVTAGGALLLWGWRRVASRSKA